MALILVIISLVIFPSFTGYMSNTELGWLTTTISASAVLTGALFLSAAGLITFEDLYRKNPIAPWATGYFASLVLGVTALLLGVLLTTGLAWITISPAWLLGGLLPIWALAVTRADFASTQLRRSRGEVGPRHYINRYKAINTQGDDEFDTIRSEVESVIERRGFSPKDLTTSQRRGLVTLDVKMKRPKQVKRRRIRASRKKLKRKSS